MDVAPDVGVAICASWPTGGPPTSGAPDNALFHATGRGGVPIPAVMTTSTKPDQPHPTPPATVEDPRRVLYEIRRQQALGQFLTGLGLCALGILITLGTHSAASPNGGTYIIAYGPMIGGGVMALRGLINLV